MAQALSGFSLWFRLPMWGRLVSNLRADWQLAQACAGYQSAAGYITNLPHNLIRQQPLERRYERFRLRQNRGFQLRMIADPGIERGHPAHGSVQTVE